MRIKTLFFGLLIILLVTACGKNETDISKDFEQNNSETSLIIEDNELSAQQIITSDYSYIVPYQSIIQDSVDCFFDNDYNTFLSLMPLEILEDLEDSNDLKHLVESVHELLIEYSVANEIKSIEEDDPEKHELSEEYIISIAKNYDEYHYVTVKLNNDHNNDSDFKLGCVVLKKSDRWYIIFGKDDTEQDF